MNAPQKTDFAYFRNEILSDIKGMENKINEKIADIYKYLERINSDNEQKLGIINNKIKNIKENDSTSLEEKLNSKYEKINNKLDEKISTLGAKINMVKKDLSDACFRYDKIIIDNLKVTGLIGEGCTFTNLKNFIEFIYKNITEISVAKEKIVNEINALNPDIVIITGDFVDGTLKITQEMLNPFDTLTIPILYVTGNHEVMYGKEEFLKLISNTRIKHIGNSNFEYKNINFVGADWEDDIETILYKNNKKENSNCDVNVLITHAPLKFPSDLIDTNVFLLF